MADNAKKQDLITQEDVSKTAEDNIGTKPTITDMINVSPNVDPIDHFISSYYKPLDLNDPNLSVAAHPGRAFLHGLTFHNYGPTPQAMMGIDGLSYFAGTLITAVAGHKVAAGSITNLFGRMSPMANMLNNTGRVLRGSAVKPAHAKEAARVAAEVTPFRSPVKPTFLDNASLQVGHRIGLEAGMWYAGDAELDGAEGLRDAMIYTVLGESMGWSIAKLASKAKQGLKKSKPDSGSKEVVSEENIGTHEGDLDFIATTKGAYDEIATGEIKEPKTLSLADKEKGKRLFDTVKNNINKLIDLTNRVSIATTNVNKALLKTWDARNVVNNKKFVNATGDVVNITPETVEVLTGRELRTAKIISDIDHGVVEANRKQLLDTLKTEELTLYNRLIKEYPELENMEIAKLSTIIDSHLADGTQSLKKLARKSIDEYYREVSGLSPRVFKDLTNHFKLDSKMLTSSKVVSLLKNLRKASRQFQKGTLNVRKIMEKKERIADAVPVNSLEELAEIAETFEDILVIKPGKDLLPEFYNQRNTANLPLKQVIETAQIEAAKKGGFIYIPRVGIARSLNKTEIMEQTRKVLASENNPDHLALEDAIDEAVAIGKNKDIFARDAVYAANPYYSHAPVIYADIQTELVDESLEIIKKLQTGRAKLKESLPEIQDSGEVRRIKAVIKELDKRLKETQTIVESGVDKDMKRIKIREMGVSLKEIVEMTDEELFDLARKQEKTPPPKGWAGTRDSVIEDYTDNWLIPQTLKEGRRSKTEPYLEGEVADHLWPDNRPGDYEVMTAKSAAEQKKIPSQIIKEIKQMEIGKLEPGQAGPTAEQFKDSIPSTVWEAFEIFRQAFGNTPVANSYRKFVTVIDESIKEPMDAIAGVVKGRKDAVTIKPSVEIRGDFKWTATTPRANPKTLYIFGDNANPRRTHTKGSAVVRNAANSIGIVTKKSPTEFYSDADFDLLKVKAQQRIQEIQDALNKGNYENIKIATLGGKNARITKERTPKLYKLFRDTEKKIENMVLATEPAKTAEVKPAKPRTQELKEKRELAVLMGKTRTKAEEARYKILKDKYTERIPGTTPDDYILGTVQRKKDYTYKDGDYIKNDDVSLREWETYKEQTSKVVEEFKARYNAKYFIDKVDDLDLSDVDKLERAKQLMETVYMAEYKRLRSFDPYVVQMEKDAVGTAFEAERADIINQLVNERKGTVVYNNMDDLSEQAEGLLGEISEDIEGGIAKGEIDDQTLNLAEEGILGAGSPMSNKIGEVQITKDKIIDEFDLPFTRLLEDSKELARSIDEAKALLPLDTEMTRELDLPLVKKYVHDKYRIQQRTLETGHYPFLQASDGKTMTERLFNIEVKGPDKIVLAKLEDIFNRTSRGLALDTDKLLTDLVEPRKLIVDESGEIWGVILDGKEFKIIHPTNRYGSRLTGKRQVGLTGELIEIPRYERMDPSPAGPSKVKQIKPAIGVGEFKPLYGGSRYLPDYAIIPADRTGKEYIQHVQEHSKRTALHILGIDSKKVKVPKDITVSDIKPINIYSGSKNQVEKYMSNFAAPKGGIRYKNVVYKTVEHAYQDNKTGKRLDLFHLKGKHGKTAAAVAKKLGRKWKPDIKINEDLMQELLEARMLVDKRFKQYILNPNATFTHNVGNISDHWTTPGGNALVKIINRIREKFGVTTAKKVAEEVGDKGTSMVATDAIEDLIDENTSISLANIGTDKNYIYIKSRIGKILDETVPYNKWAAGDAKYQAKYVPLTKQFLGELVNRVDNTLIDGQAGTMKDNYIRKMLDELLVERKINLDDLAEGYYGKKARDLVAQSQAAIERAGTANQFGMDPNDALEIWKMKKVYKHYGENLDKIVGRDQPRINKLIEETNKAMQEINDLGYMNAGIRTMDELKIMADYIKMNTAEFPEARASTFIKMMRGMAKDLNAQEKALAKSDYNLGPLDAGKHNFSNSKHKGYNKWDKLFRNDAILQVKAALKEIWDAKEKFEHDFKLNTVDDFIDNKEVLRTMEGKALLMKAFTSKILGKRNKNLVQHVMDFTDEVPLSVISRKGQRGLPSRPFEQEYQRLYRMDRQSPFEESWSNPGSNLYNQRRLLAQGFIGYLVNSPQAWSQFVRKHGYKNQAIDELWHLIRYSQGDDQAGFLYQAMKENQSTVNLQRMYELEFILDNPQTGSRNSIHNNPNDATSPRDNKQLYQQDDGPPPDDTGGPGPGDNIPPPSEFDVQGGYLGDIPPGSRTGGPQNTMAINPVGAQLYNDPADIAKWYYNVSGDETVLHALEASRVYVNEIAELPRVFDEVFTESGLKEALETIGKELGEDGLKTNIYNTVRVLELVDEQALKISTKKQRALREFAKGDVTEEARLVKEGQLDEKAKKIINSFESARLNELSPESRKLHTAIRTFLDKTRQVYVDDVMENTDLITLRDNSGLDALKDMMYQQGYWPRPADGNWEASILVNGSRKPIITARSRNEMDKEIRRWLRNNPDEKNRKFYLTPTHIKHELLDNPEFSSSLNKRYSTTIGEAQDIIKRYGTEDPSIVNLIARHAKSRGTDLMQTPEQDMLNTLRSYFYNTYKAAKAAPFFTASQIVQKNAAKNNQIPFGNYWKSHTDGLLGRVKPVEKLTNETIDGLVNYLRKIPVVNNALDNMGFYEGGAHAKALSGLLTSTASILTLGLNISTALLQYTIVGLNVLPRMVVNGGGKHLITAMKNAYAMTKPGNKFYNLYKKSKLDLYKHEGIVRDVLEENKLVEYGPTRKAFRKFKEMAMWMFQEGDSRSRMFTLIAAREQAEEIVRNIIRKQKRLASKQKVLTAENYKDYLTQDERIMWLAAKRKGRNITDFKRTGKGKTNMDDLLDDYAIDFMEETNHTYNGWNNPLAFNHPVAKPFLQFKTWVQKEIKYFMNSWTDTPKELSAIEQYKHAIAMTGAFTAIGGIFSLPGMEELDTVSRWAFGYSPKSFFYEQDSPIQDMIAGGIFTGSGISLAGRAGPGNVVQLFDTENLFGITASRFFHAASAFANGQPDRALNYALPRFLQNAKQGYEMATTGKLMNTYNPGIMFNVDDMSTNKIVAIMGKIAGFQSMDEMRYQTIKYGLIHHGAHKGRDRRWTMNALIELLDDNQIQKAKELAAEADIEWTHVRRYYKEKRAPEYQNLKIPYIKKDEISEILGEAGFEK